MKKNCWLCGEVKLACVKTADVPSTVDATAFRVSDVNYGRCAAVYQCPAGGFSRCLDFSGIANGRAAESFRFAAHCVPARIVEASFLILICLVAGPQTLR
jgi:hypothetical protein